VHRWYILRSYSWTQTFWRNPPTAFIFWVLSSNMYTQFNDHSLQPGLFTKGHWRLLHNSHSHTATTNIFFWDWYKASDCVKRDILPQNVTHYHKNDILPQKWHITTKRHILPQHVTYYHKTWHITTKRDILPQNVTHYHKSDITTKVTYCHNTWHITTKRDTLPQNVAYYRKTWHITTKRDILLQKIISYATLFTLGHSKACSSSVFHTWSHCFLSHTQITYPNSQFNSSNLPYLLTIQISLGITAQKMV